MKKNEARAEFEKEKKEVEKDVIRLLKQTKSDFTLEDVKSVIYFEEETDDMQKVIMMFDDGKLENMSNVVELATDAWNYFPHKILDGFSPKEKLLG